MDPRLLTADSVERLLLAVGLGAARTVPLTWLVPAFGGRHVSSALRVGLGIALALLAAPRLAAAVPAGAGPIVWTALVGREVLVGLTVGLCASFAFRAAEAAGRLTDILRGANLTEVISPASEERSSPLGELSLLLAVVIFFEIGGVRALVTALARSYEAVPVAATASTAAARGAAEVVAYASAKLIEAAVGFSAPIIVAFLLADLALGAMARAVPQIPVYFVAMPLKALLGVGLTLLGIGALDAALAGGFGGWLELVDRAFDAWAPR